jgi:hypothetical protein
VWTFKLKSASSCKQRLIDRKNQTTDSASRSSRPYSLTNLDAAHLGLDFDRFLVWRQGAVGIDPHKKATCPIGPGTQLESLQAVARKFALCAHLARNIFKVHKMLYTFAKTRP